MLEVREEQVKYNFCPDKMPFKMTESDTKQVEKHI